MSENVIVFENEKRIWWLDDVAVLLDKLIGDAVMLRDEKILNGLSDNEIPLEDENILELLSNVATVLEDENHPGLELGKENELWQEDRKYFSLLIIDVTVLDKADKIGWLFTDFVVLEDEDTHTWLWISVLVFGLGSKCGLLLDDNLKLECESKVRWSQDADLVFKIEEKYGSLSDFDSALGDKHGILLVALIVFLPNSYSMRYMG